MASQKIRLVQRLDLVRDVAKGKRVLHLGCTNAPYTQESIDSGMLLHNDLAEISSDLWGMDADEDGLDVLRSNGHEHLVYGDLEKLEECDLDGTFDVIIGGEMIEHLNNPGLFLRGIKRFMNDDTRLVITTINAYCAMRFLWYGMRGKGGVKEMVHPDHVAYYSYSTLKLLIERHDIEVEEFLFYDIGKEHRPHNRRYLNMINDVAVRLAPQWADGLIAVCKLKPKSLI